jgi:hypothetical protein
MECVAQAKEYKLIAKTARADINYPLLKKMNTLEGSDTAKISKAFQPIKGKFTVYQFLATYQGVSFRGPGEWTFHDLLTLKTDVKGKILDAYHYTLEWAEPPASSDLFKSSVKNIIIKNNLSIDLLQFMRTAYLEDFDTNRLEDKGVLKLK